MVKVFCAIVGDTDRAFCVQVVEDDCVHDLKVAIKDANPNDLKNVDADTLELFLAKKGTTWLKEQDLIQMRERDIHEEDERNYMGEALKLSTDEIRPKFPTPIPEGTIPVLVKVPSRVFSMWERVPRDFPALVIGNNPLVRIPAAYTRDSGLTANEDKDLLLYRRSQLIEEWQSIKAYVCKTFAELWIVGPPGTGKSCAAFAFACSLDRTDWDILWPVGMR
ncbi:hypothetical protein P3T76_013478 [Phytophthora citrophthora]|uniref:Crinkler effector protein N-terminal domain-containing protein n=1 Tax=Phytophthora citrophthora TaxID=4793 RepID=A0AAD9G2N5_9STRA|nr:hypothetical protein P3T76_013478 [Phytophthora citrophthora]